MKPLSFYIKNPRYLGLVLTNHLQCLPDKTYLKLRFYFETGDFLHLKNPKTFQEKIQWLKLYDRKPEYTSLVDKSEVKKYVANKIGEEHIIPTLGVWNSPEEIDLTALPDKFVLKTTHGGGSNGVVICTDKSRLDRDAIIAKLNKAMMADIYSGYREWPYKNIPRRIIAEQLLEHPAGAEINDYKFFCFNGQVKFFKVDFDRFSSHRANYFAPDWSLLPFGEANLPPVPEKQILPPPNFDKMLEIAQTLSQPFKFIRVDLYNLDGKIYFGELTFYPASGMGSFTSKEWDRKVGDMLII